jgi:hypothetical protein
MGMDTLYGLRGLAMLLFAPAVSVVIALIIIIGGRRLRRRHLAGVTVLVLTPLVLVFGASIAGAYPISARTTLFYLPMMVILAAGGVEELARQIRRPIVSFLVLIAPCVPLAWIALRELSDANPREHVRPLITSLQTLRRPGQPVYVFAGAIPAWAMYTTDWMAPDRARLEYLERIGRADGPAFENAPSRSRRVTREGDELRYNTLAGPELYGIADGLEARAFGLTNYVPDPGWADNEARRIGEAANPDAWLLFTHFYGPEGQLLDALEARGARSTYKSVRNGAVLLRYEFSR